MVLRLKWLAGLCLISLIYSASAFAKEEKVAFKKQTITVGTKKILVEIAETEQQHAYGLMFRKKLGLNEGMLFVFKDEEIRSFWMKNTLINLSIGYFDKNKKLIDIQEMKAMTSLIEKETPSYPSKGPAQYALEMSEGWFKKNKILIGDRFSF